MQVLKPSFAAFLTSKVDSMPSASTRFIGKVKNTVALKQRNNLLRSLQERKRWMMEKAQAEGESERERELPPSLSIEEDQRFVLCITMDIRSAILMSGCVMLLSQGLYLMGKQVVIAWKSMDVFSNFIGLHSYLSDTICGNQKSKSVLLKINEYILG